MKNTFFVLSILLSAACSAERRAIRQEEKEISVLGEAAQLYWHALRWADYGSAASFYLDPEYRVEWMNQMVTSPDYRYSAAEVIRVEVSPEHDPDEDGVIREGRVFIQVQGYRMPEQVMEQTLTTQLWSRYEAGWFIPDSSEEP